MNPKGYDRTALRQAFLGLAVVAAAVGVVVVSGALFSVRGVLAADPITVNSTADDTLENLAGNATCDLREAIVAANTDSQVGQCNAGGTAATTIEVSAAGAIALTADLPTITDTLTINGPIGASLTIDGAGSFRQFWIDPGIEVEMSGLTLANGYASVPVWPFYAGGAVHNEGILTLDEMTIVGSVSAAAQGGAVYSTGRLTVTNSLIYSNTAHTRGGGICVMLEDCSVPTSTLTLVNSAVYSNTAGQDGGGIYISSSMCWPAARTLAVDGSTVSGNSANRGGGVYLYYASGTFRNTTISGNEANDDGGGVCTLADWDQTVDLVNCTVYDNTGDDHGGGMFIEPTFRVNVKNTILAGNSAGVAGPEVWGAIESYDYNLIQDTSGATLNGLLGHTITGSSPLLGPLADNGGPTWTHALLPGSPAINAGSCTDIAGDPIATDQRGVGRISPCDIGAWEYVLRVYLPQVMRNSP
jgi:CSLREA domain-containing protein